MAARILILGAAGSDFHNFNMVYRDDPETRVVAFTQAQIPRLSDRRYPASLAGPHYPDGIAILDEALEAICLRERVDRVVFAYSDVSHATVMHLASGALAPGADFELLGPNRTMLRARVPVIALSASCGKSQTLGGSADGCAAGTRPRRSGRSQKKAEKPGNHGLSVRPSPIAASTIVPAISCT